MRNASPIREITGGESEARQFFALVIENKG
jgi:hypothetical protein